MTTTPGESGQGDDQNSGGPGVPPPPPPGGYQAWEQGQWQQPPGPWQQGQWQQPPGPWPQPGGYGQWQQPGGYGQWQQPFAGPPTLASYGQRMGGMAIDALIFLVPLLVISNDMKHADGSPNPVAGLIVFGLYWVYSSLMIGFGGRTVGNMAAKTRVVDGRTGMPISALRAFGRQFAKVAAWLLVILPFIVDCLFPLWDPRRQTIHDKIVGTVVVQTG